MTSKPFVSRTLATLRRAEFGFLGVVVYTRVHTPRFCGLDLSAGAPVLVFTRRRPWRISWFRVGTLQPPRGVTGSPRAGESFSPRHIEATTLPSWPQRIESGRTGDPGKSFGS